MSRKLTTQNNLSYQIQEDRRQSDIPNKKAYPELRTDENTNQSEQETAHSWCRKYDEIIEEKTEMITNLKNRIAELEIENYDIHHQILKIINWKLMIEWEFNESISTKASFDLPMKLTSKPKNKDRNRIVKKNLIMKIDLTNEFHHSFIRNPLSPVLKT